MTRKALLRAAAPDLLGERLGGLTVLQRQLFTAARAGFDEVWVEAPAPAPGLRLPQGLRTHWQGEPAPASALTLDAGRLLTVAGLKRLAQGARVEELPASASIVLRPSGPRKAALSWLLATGTKAQDGFMARYFDRHLSLGVSRLLLDTPVTPNMMTILSSGIGLYGTTFFLRPDHASRLAGALLVWLHSVLDGCDGELARMRFQESRFGGAIDFWGDNLVHLSLFGCLAWGFAKADRSVLPLLAGAAAWIGTLGSAALVYLQKLSGLQPPPTETGTFLKRLEDILAARDFIYLLVFLAFIDRTYEFMWAAGVGCLLFFIMMLYLGGRNDQISRPYPAAQGEAGYPASGHGGGL